MVLNAYLCTRRRSGIICLYWFAIIFQSDNKIEDGVIYIVLNASLCTSRRSTVFAALLLQMQEHLILLLVNN